MFTAWQGHRGDKKRKKKLTNNPPKAPKPKAEPGHYYCSKSEAWQGHRGDQKIKKN